MISRATQLLARYIGMVLLAVTVKLFPDTNPNQVDQVAQLLASGVVAAGLLLYDVILHSKLFQARWGRSLPAILLALLMFAPTARAQTVRVVRTDAELRQAALDCQKVGTMAIAVEGRIDMGGVPLSIYGKLNPAWKKGDPPEIMPRLGTCTLIAHSPGAMIVTGIGPTGDVIDWENKPNASNAFQFNFEHVAVIGLRFEDYEGNGSVVKGSGGKTFLAYDCDFRGISNKRFNTRVTPPERAGDMWFGCVIGSGGPQCDVSVINCRFVDSCTIDGSWQHLIYPVARSVRVIGCDFRNSGQAMQLGSFSGGSVFVLDNTINPSVPMPYRGDLADVRPPFLLDVNNANDWLIAGNTFEGPFSTMYLNTAPRAGALNNDYASATWASWGATPWQDVNSRFPK